MGTVTARLPRPRRGPASWFARSLRRRGSRAIALATAGALFALAPFAPAGALASGAGGWSAPALLSACSARAQLRVLFPSDSPVSATGPGAIVWASGADCPGGEGTRVSALGAGDVPAAAGAPLDREPAVLGLREATAAGGPHGRIVIAGISTRDGSPQLLEGVAGSPLAAPGAAAQARAPLALSTAYLGDVALGAAGPRGGLQVRVERYFARSYGPWRSVLASGAVSAATLALDYRTDLLAVWQQDGSLWARDLPASGAAGPIQRLGAAAAGVHVAALRSDDNRAIVAWSEDRAGTTSVYLAQSGEEVRFDGARLLERFRDPQGLATPPASPALVRLRSESVMIAWAGAAGERWVVRTAPIDQHGLRSVSTIAGAEGACPSRCDALLAGLAPGPEGGAVALWSEPLVQAGGVPDMNAQALEGARGIETSPGVARFGAPEAIAPPGPLEDAAVALDPDGAGAIAAWRAGDRGVFYSSSPARSAG